LIDVGQVNFSDACKNETVKK